MGFLQKELFESREAQTASASIRCGKPCCVKLFASGRSGVLLEARTHKCFLDIVISCSDCSIDEAFEIKHRALFKSDLHNYSIHLILISY